VSEKKKEEKEKPGKPDIARGKDKHKEKGKTDLHKDTERGGKANKSKHIVDDAM
jgi:hypothetical protein